MFLGSIQSFLIESSSFCLMTKPYLLCNVVSVTVAFINRAVRNFQCAHGEREIQNLFEETGHTDFR